jgi:hypothetical protein
MREGDAFQDLEEQQRLFDAFARRKKRRRTQSRRPTFSIDPNTVHGLDYFACLIRGLVGIDSPADAGGRRKRYPWTLSVAAADKLFTPLAKRGLCTAVFTATSGRVEFSCLNKVVAAFGKEPDYYAR